jgi:hypothetical protein
VISRATTSESRRGERLIEKTKNAELRTLYSMAINTVVCVKASKEIESEERKGTEKRGRETENISGHIRFTEVYWYLSSISLYLRSAPVSHE